MNLIYYICWTVVSPCCGVYIVFCSDFNKDWTHKNKGKDKGQDYKDHDKDKDLKLVLKESLRIRTRTNITDLLHILCCCVA